MKSNTKILIIDDEPGMRDWLSFELNQQGYSVITAQDGNKGIELIKKERIDIAIVDMKMPGMDGIAVLDTIKKINSDIEVIICTGFATMETVVTCMKKGACDYINKPYDVDEITISIEKAIEKHQLKETIILYEMSKAILSTVELGPLLKIIIDLTTKVLSADDASLLLFDNEKRFYIASSSFHVNCQSEKESVLAVGERALSLMAENKQPLLFENGIDHDPRFNDINFKQKGSKSSIVFPLNGKNGILGILTINRFEIKDPFTQNDLRKGKIFTSQTAIAVETAYLFTKINSLYMSTIRSLANVIDAKDPYTNRHSERVAELAAAIGMEMDLPSETIQKILQASQVHDLGKIGINDAIIMKTEKLSEVEIEEMKTHPFIAAQILQPLEFLTDIVEVVKQHHEKYDGTGYPCGLKGDAICLEARIIAAADAYDAMTTDRPYRKGLSIEKAINELENNINTQFDPGVIAALVRVLGKRIIA